MRRLAKFLLSITMLLAIVGALAAPVWAQPSKTVVDPDAKKPPAAAPEPAPIPEPDSAPVAEPVEELPVPADANLRAIYDRAFEAFARGELDVAIAGFAEVASRASRSTMANELLVSSAREMARLAQRLRSERVKLVRHGSIKRTLTEDDQPGSGRTSVVVGTTIAGFYGGLVLIDLADVDDFRVGTLLVVGATGAAFVGSLLGSQDSDVTSGVADAYTTGLTVGGLNGLLLASPIGLDDGSEQVFGLGLVGMALGGVSGYLLAERARPTVGQVSMVGTAGALGLATTLLGTLVVTGEDPPDADAMLLIIAGGLNAGLVAGLAISPKLTWSKSRARLVGLGMFLGGLAGFGGAALLLGTPDDIDQARGLSAASLAGLWGGVLLTAHLTRNMKPDGRFAPSEQQSVSMFPAVIENQPGVVVGGTF